MPGMDGFEALPTHQADRRPADHRPLRGGCQRGKGARSRGVRGGLRHQAVRPRRAGRPRAARPAAIFQSGRGRAIFDEGQLEIDLVQRQVMTAAGTHSLTPTEIRVLQVMIGVAGQNGAHRDPPRARLVGIRWRRSVVRLGHHAPPAPQDRGGSGQSPLPADGAGRRLSAGFLMRWAPGRARPADLTMGPLPLRNPVLVLPRGGRLPPLIVFAVLQALAPDLLDRIGMGTALLAVALLASVWSAMVGIVGSRANRKDVDAILALAELGDHRPWATSRTPRAGKSVRAAGRARSTSAIARSRTWRAHVRSAPIEEDARAVARSVVAWASLGEPRPNLVAGGPADARRRRCCPPASTRPTRRRRGSLGDCTGGRPRCGATTLFPGVRHAMGPWGAFVIVEVAAGEELRASLHGALGGPRRARAGRAGAAPTSRTEQRYRDRACPPVRACSRRRRRS